MSTSNHVCPKCGKKSDWPGACDACVDAFDKRLSRLERTQAIQRSIWCGYLFPGWRIAGWEISKIEVEEINVLAWSELRGWNGQANLYLWGPPGVGKTFGAQIAITKFALDTGFTIAGDTLSMIIQDVNSWNEPRYRAQRMLAAHVLLLDDIDKVTWSPRNLEAFQHIMDRREKCGGRTVVTSNVSPTGFAQILKAACPPDNTSFAEAILSRFNPCTKIELFGVSQRRKAE